MSSIKINLYCDESGAKDQKNNQNLQYYGLLIVPEKKRRKLAEKLINARCIPKKKWKKDGCDDKCGYHQDNNTEIHYNDLRSDYERRIAKRWIKILLEECKNDDWNAIYFNILGLIKSRIRKGYWGNYEKVSDKIYAKFFFSIIKSIKGFFPNYDEIIIKKIIHDDSSLERDNSEYYNGLFESLHQEKKITLEDSNITYINSDHRESEYYLESHFIQFIDLILGLTNNYVHFRSENEVKIELTKIISELLRRLINNPNNVNSSYNYVGKKQIRFFPSEENFYQKNQNLEGVQVEQIKDGLFYSNKKCLFEEKYKDENQKTLEKFLSN